MIPKDIYQSPRYTGPIRKLRNSKWLDTFRFRKNKQQKEDPTIKPEDNAKDQFAHDHNLKVEKDKQIMDELVRKSNRSIIRISSTFPWNIFPNIIDVEESRVTFIFHQFLTSQTHSVDIKDISNVFIESGFLYATLQVVSRTFVQNDIKVGYLNKSQAVKVKVIIEGLRTFNNNNIDTSTYEVPELIDKLSALHLAR